MAVALSSVFENLKQVDPNTVTFTLSPTNVAYANTLRRSIQTEVEILGFRADMLEDGSTTDVKVFKNTTPMSNEMLADRIGLLPIAMDTVDPGSWVKDKIVFKLHVKNDSTDSYMYVDASMFEVLELKDGEEEPVRLPSTDFFHPSVIGDTCLIAVLKPHTPGQAPEEIHLEARASFGRGKEHTRFNPTSQCAYGYTRDENEGRISQLWMNWLTNQKKLDPGDVDKGDPLRKESLQREFRSLELYRCYKIDAKGEPYSYDFTVESVGAYPVTNSVYDGCMAVASLCDKYAAIDKGDLPPNLEVKPADARMKGFDFWFSEEDHTLGNLLQTWLDENKVGRGPKAGGCTFAGYKIPHPLRAEMVLRLGVEDGQMSTARKIIAEGAKACADMFRQWAANWAGAVSDSGIALTPRGAKKNALRGPWDEHAAVKGAEAAASAARAAAGADRGRGRGRGRGGPARGGRGGK
jgi:DNA-directed RNA polymerase subunit L/DNA-directed RNA polymerase alpha subunit